MLKFSVTPNAQMHHNLEVLRPSLSTVYVERLSYLLRVSSVQETRKRKLFCSKNATLNTVSNGRRKSSNAIAKFNAVVETVVLFVNRCATI